MRFILDNLKKLKAILTEKSMLRGGRQTKYDNSTQTPRVRKAYRVEKPKLVKFASISCAAVISVVAVTSVFGTQGKAGYGNNSASTYSNAEAIFTDETTDDNTEATAQDQTTASGKIASSDNTDAVNKVVQAMQSGNVADSDNMAETSGSVVEQTADAPQDDSAESTGMMSMGDADKQAQAEESQKSVVLDVAPETQSEDTKKLQERLIELNYMESDDPTGYYGSVTAEAVGFFQRKHDLPRDGVAGEETQAVMFSDEAKPYTVTLDATGLDVENIQGRLEELGYPVEVTGYYGVVTEDVVGYFQRMNGLDDDGSVGEYTRELLFSETAVPALPDEPAEEESTGESLSDNSENESSSNNAGSSDNTESSSSGNNSSSGGESSAPAPSTPAPDISNQGGVEGLIEFAMTQLGKPYVRGGKGPDVFDCSGFVYYALNQSGYSIGYMTSGGWGSSGYTTIGSMSELQRGDIVCFNGHVGIYLGDGNMIDSRPSAGGVVITENIFNSSYWTSNFKSGKRIF